MALRQLSKPLASQLKLCTQSSSFFTTSKSNANNEARFNPLGIRMLPTRLHRQVFGLAQAESDHIWHHTPQSAHNVQRCIDHLKRHDLLPDPLKEIDTVYEYNKHLSATPSEDISLDIPTLVGRNINAHFHNLGRKYSVPYRQLAQELVDIDEAFLNNVPTHWSQEPGWTRYEPTSAGTFVVTKVNHPLERTLVFDVETCLNDTVKHAPTMAVALSPKAWYSWTSSRLRQNKCDSNQDSRDIGVEDLIPFKSSKKTEKLIVGHNVGFDRTFLRDQYDLIDSRTKFLDTLSLHMCICGLTGLQRAVKTSQKRKIRDKEPIDSADIENNPWVEKGCLNNLADVYEFHCGSQISKDERDVFITGSMDDVRDNFQPLMSYCANDVKATLEVFKKLFPTFTERFPHPVTLAGMLEMSTMYLPVNPDSWSQYVDNSQGIYDEYEERLSAALQDVANRACSLSNEECSRDVWLWEVDRSTQEIQPVKSKLALWQKHRETKSIGTLDEQVDDIYATKDLMRRVQPFLPGFPKWYRDLCCPSKRASSLNGKEWQPGPCLITTQMRITPKLMKLTWDGYPLHHTIQHGWGYLVPNGDLMAQYTELPEDHPYKTFPLAEFLELCRHLPRSHILVDDDSPIDDSSIQKRIDELKDGNTQMGTENLMKFLRKMSKKKKVVPRLKNEYCDDVDIPGAYFIKIPHKLGANYNVGNPLSKDFIAKMEDGTLSSSDDQLANLLLKHSKSLSYWKNNHKRIKNQMIVRLPGNSHDFALGAILPRVIVAGTVTRRAVEPTWLTASNQDTSRVGSELKAMIQAPTGYCFVGADVDSQELWIASLMGDSFSYKIHGGTGLSYMTLRGSKSEKTDMHSKTASLIGITRSDAKVLNYARIYGAGQKFIERFLLNTNPSLKPDEAREKAKTIFRETKGVRRFFHLRQLSQDKEVSIPVDINEKEASNYDYERGSLRRTKSFRSFWEGGTESATFNKLEEIASSPSPRTPVLDCQISQALEPAQDQSQDFVTSRVNWVVQSSAVDFLHLLLVNMKWLFERLEIEGRFSISIHDEVRYLVREEDKYKAAFALQVSNLLVRAYFAYKLKMSDLPISVAFFSSVDIDKCLRKEVDLDCKSPSNPLGLHKTFNIGPGESLDIKQLLQRYTYTARCDKL